MHPLLRTLLAATAAILLPAGFQRAFAQAAPNPTPAVVTAGQALFISAFLLDCSGSINDSDPHGIIVSLLRLSLELVRPARIVIGTFCGDVPFDSASKIGVTAPLDLSRDTDYKTAVEQADRLRAVSDRHGWNGETPTAAAIRRVYEAFDAAGADGHSPIFLGTDGVPYPDTARQYDQIDGFFAARERAGKPNYPLVCLALMQPNDTDAQQFKDRFAQSCRRTGGEFREVAAASQLVSASIDLLERYMALPKSTRDSQTIGANGAIEFHVPVDGSEHDVHILAVPSPTQGAPAQIDFRPPTWLSGPSVHDPNLSLLLARPTSNTGASDGEVQVLATGSPGQQVDLITWRESTLVARLLEPGLGGFLPAGKSARLAVSLAPRDGARVAVKNAKIQATVRRRTTGEPIFSKTLLDDGAEGDQKEGDGVFSRLVALPSTPMQLDVEIAAFVGDRALPPVVQPLETAEFPALVPLSPPDLSSDSMQIDSTISVPLAAWRLGAKPGPLDTIENVNVTVATAGGRVVAQTRGDRSALDDQGQLAVQVPVRREDFPDAVPGQPLDGNYSVRATVAGTYRGTQFVDDTFSGQLHLRTVIPLTVAERAIQLGLLGLAFGRRWVLVWGPGLLLLGVATWIRHSLRIDRVRLTAVPQTDRGVGQPRDLNRRPSPWARIFRLPGALAWISARKQLGPGIQVARDHAGRMWIRARASGHVLDGTPLGRNPRRLGDAATLRRKDNATLTIYLRQNGTATGPKQMTRRA